MLEKMKEIIAEQLSVDADSITEASSFKDDLVLILWTCLSWLWLWRTSTP